MSIKLTKLTALLTGLLLSTAVSAQTTYTDNFSSTKSSLTWTPLGFACLTAGNGTGSIPACASPKDTAGLGALRLTPAANNQTGAILSGFAPFPLSQGMQVTFTTYTYGGDSGGTAKNGADGITFILTDGTVTAPTTTGGEGGSMGYSCSNSNGKYEGMANAYLGLGIDEFGNYLNPGDNTDSGIYNTNSSLYKDGSTYGTNTFQNGDSSKTAGGGWFYQPERIGLRGAGNTTWAWLRAQNASYYSGSADATKTKAACSSGNYVSATKGDGSPKTYKKITYNYNAIPGGYKVLPNSTPIANENTSTRAGSPSSPADYTKNAWPITYKLTISPSGLLNFSYSYNNGAFQPVLVNSLITASNGPLPASLRFGFSAGTGGSNNVHEITCFQASPLQSNSSASANTVQSGQVKIGSQIYLASYSADNWFGSLVSDSLVTTGNTLSVATVANWDARCVLTGGKCAAMGTDAQGNATTTVGVQGPDSRTLMTWDGAGATALPLQWGSLTAAQKTSLNRGGADTAGPDRLKWLRGDRSVEQLASPTPGALRARTAVLGDIINSSPTWVGAPVSGANPDVFTDGLYGSAATPPENQTGAQAYSAFASSNATRLNVVYVGGNDGFLHGFRAGSYDASGNYTAVNASNTYVGTNNDGREVIGFMPSAVLSKVAATSTGLASPTYVHDYFVDATPAAGDLFYGNAWHTWLVGGVGTGGKEIYALDITDPTKFSETTTTPGIGPSAVVKGDWTSATTGLSNLGKTVGTPLITRMHNGQWAIVFGNGVDSGTSAGVYVGLVDSTSGAITFKFLDTGVGSSSVANGIAYVTSADLDGDRIADYLYAGDLLGNVWRFDVTSQTPASWTVSKVFVAKDGSPTPKLQPITTAPVIAAVKTGSVNRVMVLFGTGQKVPLSTTSGDSYASGQQTFYGIWDANMTAWNLASPKKQYASLATVPTITRTALLAQNVVSTSVGSGSVLGYRNLSTTNVVCWSGSTTCSGGAASNAQFGWRFDLPATQEQIVYNPAIVGGAVVVSTAIPPTISALQCNPGLQSGWTMAFDPASGGALPSGFFPNGNGSFGNNSDSSATGGIRVDAVGSPTAVTYGGQTYIVTQTVSGSAALSPVNPPSNDVPSRISWREIRN
ncbi:type IV pilus assembly protein PilY1 [Rhodanobacter sp. TND4EL1]